MLADLVNVTTADGIVLSGAYFAPANVGSQQSIDALLFFHGDSGNFYGSLYLDLGRRMAEMGIAFLSANRRGHDHVASGAKGGPLAGYAFESVDHSRLDFGAWLELLRKRGHRRIAIGGHSGGAVRAVYAQAMERFDDVIGVVAVSPGEYDHEGIIALHQESFTMPFREAQKNVAENQSDLLLRPGVPWGSTWSSGAYVDCFNPDNRYSVTTHTQNTGCPTLFIFGGEECSMGGPQELPVCGAAQRSLRSVGYSHVKINEIQGASHGYAGREAILADTMSNWLRDL